MSSPSVQGRLPRTSPLPHSYDPLRPPTLSTSPSDTLQDSNAKIDVSASKGQQSSTQTKSTPWATHPADPPKLKETIRDLQRFLKALPFPLINITPAILARVVSRAFASQGLMPTDIVSLFDVRTPTGLTLHVLPGL